jgi:hypothetical protein
MSQQLTARQQTQLEKIAQAGEIIEIAFARKTISFDKIRNIPRQEVGEGLGMIFTKVSNLSGLKDPISDINKQDIKEMILSRFAGLSLEEIDFAFKLERYGAYGDKTPHYQLFNSEFVSTILNKYKKWLNETRVNNNLPIAEAEKPKEITEEEKQLIVYAGVIGCFRKYEETKHIESGKGWVYDFFFEKGRLPKHTNEFKTIVKAKAKTELENEIKSGGINLQVKEALKSIQPSTIAVKCKEIILREYFDKLIKENIDIKDEMK